MIFIPALSTRQNAYVPPCGPDRPLNPSLRPWYIYTGFCLDYVGECPSLTKERWRSYSNL